MINTSYNQEENIVHMARTGEIHIAELFSQVQETVSNYKDLKCLYILDDSRSSTPHFSSRDYPDLGKQIRKGLEHFVEVRHAILVASPMNTALGVLFEGIAGEIPCYSFKTFFSEEDAKEWLKEGIQCP